MLDKIDTIADECHDDEEVSAIQDVLSWVLDASRSDNLILDCLPAEWLHLFKEIN
jgi:hypothetical protein